MNLTYRTNLKGVDWDKLKQDLIKDNFYNGRTTYQLKLSFENSTHVALAWDGPSVIGTARLLSDGVGNAYVIDVWTQTAYKRKGIASKLMKTLIDAVPGQHVYLQTDHAAVAFYKKLGFKEQPTGLSLISGSYLENESRDNT